MNFSREFDYTIDDATDDLSGLAFWNIRSDGDYYYDQPSSEMQRIFTLSTLSTTGPLQPSSNPCPAGTNCTYTISFLAAAYGCEARDEFGGGPDQQQYRASDLLPTGDVLYASYSALPMGPEDEYGAPLAWEDMSDDDPALGVFTGLPSLWLGWCTAEPTDESQWANPEPHIVECQMYNATYSFDITFSDGDMTVENSKTELNNLLLPDGATKSPNATDYLEFGFVKFQVPSIPHQILVVFSFIYTNHRYPVPTTQQDPSSGTS